MGFGTTLSFSTNLCRGAGGGKNLDKMDEMIVKNAIEFIDAYSINDVEKMEELQWEFKKRVSLYGITQTKQPYLLGLAFYYLACYDLRKQEPFLMSVRNNAALQFEQNAISDLFGYAFLGFSSVIKTQNDPLEDILHEAIYSAFANEMNPNSPLSSEVKAAMYILILVHNYPQSIATFFADFKEDLINQLVDADAEIITEKSFTEDDIDNSLFYISSFCYHFIEKKRNYVANISLSIDDMREYNNAIHSISRTIIYNKDTTIEKGKIIMQTLKNIIIS